MKKVNKYIHQISVVGLILCILALNSCIDSFELQKKGTADAGFGSVSLSIGKSGVRIVQPALSMSVSSYDIQCAGPDEAALSYTGITETVLTLDNLVTGSWTFTVTARNSAGTAIAAGSSTVTIVEGDNNISVTVLPFSGNGNFSYSVSWPIDELSVETGSVAVIASLTPFNGEPVTLPCVRSSDSASGTAAVPAGYYMLSFDIEEYGNLRYRMPVGSNSTVRIVQGESTTLTLSLSADDVYERATVGTPSVNIEAGTYASAQTVTLSCSTAGATIRYTTNGTLPGQTNGIEYTGTPIAISCTQTIKAVAYKQGCNTSSILNAAYTITGTVASPVFALQPGIYYDPIEIVLSSVAENAVILYTIDGTEPGAYAGTIYSEPITLSSTDGQVTVKAISRTDPTGNLEFLVSGITSAQYMVTGYVAEPEFSVSGGTYNESFDVTLTCATADAQIYYTLDGSSPTAEYGTLYSGTPISVNRSVTLQAAAVRENWKESDAVTASYILKVKTPTSSVDSGVYFEAKAVTLSSATDGAVIYYTVDGSIPTSSSLLYSTAITIEKSKTIKAAAYKDGWDASEAVSWEYTLQCTSPVFSPEPLPIVSGEKKTVTITSVTPGSYVMYTVNSTVPNSNNGAYGSSVVINAGTTLKAIALKTGWTPSAVTTGIYPVYVPVSGVSLKEKLIVTIGETKTLTPDISPENASYKTVTWSSSNTDAAEVASDGTITAKAIGTSIITVTTDEGSFTDTCEVTVSSINLDITETTLQAGSQQQLTASVGGDTGEITFIWTSSNETAATVDNTGLVTAVVGGSAVITVKTADGVSTAECEVTVTVSASADVALYDRMTIGTEYTQVAFTSQTMQYFALDITSPDTYVFQWSDSTEGIGTHTLNASVSLLNELRTETVSGISAVDKGYTTPAAASLTAGRYWVKIATLSGTAASGTCALRVYPSSIGGMNVTLYDRFFITPVFNDISFTAQSVKWLLVNVPEDGDYELSWSDAGEGTGMATVDVSLSLYDYNRSAAVNGISLISSGYKTPVVTALTAGSYWIKLTTSSGAASTGTCSFRVRKAVQGNISITFIDRLTIVPSFTDVAFTRDKVKWFAVTVPETGNYALAWSDSGQGDITATVDVLVSLYDSGMDDIVWSCSSIDNGYSTPFALPSLDAGQYFIKIVTKNGSAATGTMKIKIYKNQ